MCGDRHKVEAKLSTLKLSLSDEKIQMLSEFVRHVPVPHSSSMMAIEDCVDGPIEEPTLPSMVTLSSFYSNTGEAPI